LGGLLGGLNGFLIINLVKEYLNGSNLPTGSQGPATEVAVAGGQTVGVASSGVGFALTDLPGFTNLPAYAGWIIVGFGLLLLTLIVRSRIAGARFPAGYRKAELKRKQQGIFVPVIVKK
jgi:hypothetical protein